MTGKPRRNWQQDFGEECLRKPGQHCLISGINGSGKTTTLEWCLEGIRKLNPDEYLYWLDMGKASEALTLMTIAPVRFIIPRGMDLKVHINPECHWHVHEYEVVHVNSSADVWANARKGWINVIAYMPYILDVGTYTAIVNRMFKKLLRSAHEGSLPVPMTLFADEFHNICPAPGSGLSAEHYKIGPQIQLNVEQLRAWRARIVASSQGSYKLRRGVRSQFPWLIIKHGAMFSKHDEPRLERFNSVWSKLDTSEMVLVFPNKVFSDKIQIAPYPQPSSIGRIEYIGLFEIPGAKETVEDEMMEAVEEAAPGEVPGCSTIF